MASETLPIKDVRRVDLTVGEQMRAVFAYKIILLLGSKPSSSKVNKDFHISRSITQSGGKHLVSPYINRFLPAVINQFISFTEDVISN